MDRSRLTVVLLLTLALLAGCGGDTEPPYMGAFYRDGGEFVELPQSTRYPFGVSPDDPQLEAVEAIYVKYPIPSLDDLVLQKVPGNEKVATTIDVKSDMVYELKPRSTLDHGDYCLVVGDWMKSLENLTRWCFSVGDGSSSEAAPGPVQMTRDMDGMQMVLVPAGEFLMGNREPNRNTQNEAPLHVVFLDAFWIDQTEVTIGMYWACVEAGSCRTETACGGSHEGWAQEYSSYPISCVNWGDAIAYCKWAGARLPTEAEWEKAARGTDERRWPWGDFFDATRLNYCDDTGYCQVTGSQVAVGSYPSGTSPYGALDMAGNVWEWVADRYESDYYANSPYQNPQGPSGGSEYVIRGGGWLSALRYTRTTSRTGASPTAGATYLGFRCAMSADE
jgi:formylglycine-generating enzyme required for sulfatase activity